MADPRWTAEFTVRDNKTGAVREVRIDSPELSDATVGVLKAMGAVFEVELAGAARQIEQAFNGARAGTPGG